MNNQIEELLLDIQAQQNQNDLIAKTKEAIALLGGKFFIYIRESSALSKKRGQIFLAGAFPDAWGHQYKDLNLNLRDPSLLHARKSGVPFVWRWGAGSGGRSSLAVICQRHNVWPIVSCPIHDINGIGCFTIATNKPSKNLEQLLPKKISLHMGHIAVLSVDFHEKIKTLNNELNVFKIYLTEREKECLSLASTGLSVAQIAEKLNVTPRTVTFHFSNTKKKMFAKSILQAVAIATTMNLI